MPTRAGCHNCNWKQEFQNHGKAKQAAVYHKCDDPSAWVKDFLE